MTTRYVICPQYDEATSTCLVAHEYAPAPSSIPSLTAEEGAFIGQKLLLLFVAVWVVSLIRKAASDRVES